MRLTRFLVHKARLLLFAYLCLPTFGCRGEVRQTAAPSTTGGEEPAAPVASRTAVASSTPSMAVDGSKSRIWRIGLPAKIQTVLWMPRDKFPVFQVVRDKDPCVRRLSSEAAGVYQLTDGLGAMPFHVLVSKVDRTAVETCAVSVMASLGQHLQLSRDGRTTTFRLNGKEHFLVFGKGLTVWHGDRAAAEAILPKLEQPTVRPEFAALATGRDVERARMLFMSLTDYFGAFTGVESRAVVGTIGDDKIVHLEVHFVDPATAQRAISALDAKRQDNTLPAPLRSLLGRLHPRADGSRVSLRLEGDALKIPGLLQALESLVSK